MTAEIVGNHDVVRHQAWSKLLFDIGEEQLATVLVREWIAI